MRIDTKIISIHCIVTAILTRTRFLAMTALIRILCGLPKDERGISQILKKHTSEVWKQQTKKKPKNKNQKKNCMDPIARLSKNIEES
jgi:hypothetical protein